jgi:hypothetical protein
VSARGVGVVGVKFWGARGVVVVVVVTANKAIDRQVFLTSVGSGVLCLCVVGFWLVLDSWFRNRTRDSEDGTNGAELVGLSFPVRATSPTTVLRKKKKKKVHVHVIVAVAAK